MYIRIPLYDYLIHQPYTLHRLAYSVMQMVQLE